MDPHGAGVALGARVGPRLVGVFGLGLALLFFGINKAFGLDGEALVFGMVLVPVSGWVLATGRTSQSTDNPPWWTAGHYSALALGAIAGFATWWTLGTR